MPLTKKENEEVDDLSDVQEDDDVEAAEFEVVVPQARRVKNRGLFSWLFSR